MRYQFKKLIAWFLSYSTARSGRRRCSRRGSCLGDVGRAALLDRQHLLLHARTAGHRRQRLVFAEERREHLDVVGALSWLLSFSLAISARSPIALISRSWLSSAVGGVCLCSGMLEGLTCSASARAI